MEKLLLKMLEEAKKDRTQLRQLKIMSVKMKQFELAANIRDIEVQICPEEKQYRIERENAAKLNLVFRMVDLNVPESACWLINATLKKYWKRRGNFDIRDSVDLIAKKNEIFLKEE